MSEEKSTSSSALIIVAVIGFIAGFFVGRSGSGGEGDQGKTQQKESGAQLRKKPATPVKPLKPKIYMAEGLIAYYPFNGNAKDESGNTNETEVIGASLTVDRHGQDGKAYSFDGKDDYIDIKTPIFPVKPSSHTVSAWAVVDDAYPDGPFFVASDRYGSSCDYKYTIVIEKNADTRMPTFTHYVTGAVGGFGHKGLKANSRTVESGTWLHLVSIYNLESKLMTLYVNGKKEQEMSVLNSKGVPIWSSLPNRTSIGCWRGCQSLVGANDLTGFSTGKIDDLRFYNRALSAKEVEALHEQERPKE